MGCVPGTVVFPARNSFNNFPPRSGHGVLFEIWTKSGPLPEGATRTGDLALNGGMWTHGTMNMDPARYQDVVNEHDVSAPMKRKDIRERLFSSLSGGRTTRFMGIANTTPDSFYPGSRMQSGMGKLLDALIDQRPDIIDIGGESTRPGSSAVSVDTEISRIRPALEYIRSCSDIPVSVDTRNHQTAEFAVLHGADYINDISGFSDPGMMRVAAESGARCIGMHMRGQPDTMQSMTHYGDLVFEINLYLQEMVERMADGGIEPGSMIVDPGIGFAKDLSGNLDIINNIQSFNFGFPVLAGASRKGFIGRITGSTVENRLPGTIATSIYMARNGVDIIRVHDVAENREGVIMFSAIEHNDWSVHPD